MADEEEYATTTERQSGVYKFDPSIEPLLMDNPRRFVIFPIQYDDIWQMYKKVRQFSMNQFYAYLSTFILLLHQKNYFSFVFVVGSSIHNKNHLLLLFSISQEFGMCVMCSHLLNGNKNEPSKIKLIFTCKRFCLICF